jgi:hypothetical protein
MKGKQACQGLPWAFRKRSDERAKPALCVTTARVFWN